MGLTYSGLGAQLGALLPPWQFILVFVVTLPLPIRLIRWSRESISFESERRARDLKFFARSAWTQAKLHDPEWHSYVYTPPPPDQPVEFTRYEWATINVGRACDFHPAMNIADLWWRPLRSNVCVDGKIIDARPIVSGTAT